MNWHTLALAGALVLSVPPVFAAPSLNAGAVLVVDADSSLQLVHHKPNHHGGPPWARPYQEREGWRDSRDRDYWRYARERDDWRYRAAPERITVCRTQYRIEFDPYEGDYVQRPVQICRERSGY